MPDPRPIVALPSRALVAVRGADWRAFLQGLLTQDVDSLKPGQARFAALLTPQGRLLHDLFVIGEADGALLDVQAAHRDDFIRRLNMYRLRARVDIAADDRPVAASFETGPGQEGLWARDPRLPALGWRVYGVDATGDPAIYDAHRLALGVPGPADWGVDRTYPIEANFDLLNGIDFQKGCFVGQETTSRMKRRGAIKSRMAPITFDGPPPPAGTEILAGTLRAGEVLSGMGGRAMALVRLDRIDGAELTADGRAVRVELPEWMAAPGLGKQK